MRIQTQAFFDELSKIAEDQFVTKERLLRALKSGLAFAGGSGLGIGAGNLLASTVLPKALQRYIPNPTASQLQKGMLLAGGLGTLGTLGYDLARARMARYVAEGDKKPAPTPQDEEQQDFLMGHEKLNPEPYSEKEASLARSALLQALAGSTLGGVSSALSTPEGESRLRYGLTGALTGGVAGGAQGALMHAAPSWAHGLSGLSSGLTGLTAAHTILGDRGAR